MEENLQLGRLCMPARERRGRAGEVLERFPVLAERR